MALLNEIFQTSIIPLLTILSVFAVVWIGTKIKSLKEKTNSAAVDTCLTILENTVTNAVIATNQTYVDALKDKNAFDKEAQQIAFNKTYQAVMQSLTESTKEGLSMVTSDLTAYITEMIEATVNEQKKGE